MADNMLCKSFVAGTSSAITSCASPLEASAQTERAI